jgi:hypothetical protein
MRFRIPKAYDHVMDWIAWILFPPPIKVWGKITLTDIALILYFVAIAVGLSIYFNDWRWLLGTALCVGFAWLWWGWK